MTFMPHLRSVDKGAFLLVRVGVNSPIRANYMFFNITSLRLKGTDPVIKRAHILNTKIAKSPSFPDVSSIRPDDL